MSRIVREVRFSTTVEGAKALEELVSRDVVPIKSPTRRAFRAAT